MDKKIRELQKDLSADPNNKLKKQALVEELAMSLKVQGNLR